MGWWGYQKYTKNGGWGVGKYAQTMPKIGSYPSDLRVAIGMDGSFVDDQHDDLLHIKNGDVP
jgi:hypothetical protein